WKCQGDAGATSGGWALGSDRAAMRDHNTFGDGKTEPGPFALARARCRSRTAAHELLEDPRQNLGGNARAVVRHAQDDLFRRDNRIDHYMASSRRMGDGIV